MNSKPVPTHEQVRALVLAFYPAFPGLSGDRAEEQRLLAVIDRWEELRPAQPVQITDEMVDRVVNRYSVAFAYAREILETAFAAPPPDPVEVGMCAGMEAFALTRDVALMHDSVRGAIKIAIEAALKAQKEQQG